MIKKVFYVLLLSLVLIGCSSDDSSSSSVLIRVEVDGVLYESNTVIAAMGNGNRYFELDSSNQDTQEGLQLRIGDFTDTNVSELSEGTVYDNSDSNTQSEIFYQITAPGGFVIGDTAGSQVTITSLNFTDNTISGTFSGSLSDGDPTNDRQLTNGTFTNISFVLSN